MMNPETATNGTNSNSAAVDPEKDMVVSVSHGDTDPSAASDEELGSEAEGSDCYESDYEYHDDDEEEQEDSKMPPHDAAVVKNGGLKRKISSSATTTAVAKASKNPHGHHTHTPVAWATTPQAGLLDSTVCGICDREEHSPVLDCPMVTDWLELAQDKAAGIVSVSSECIQSCRQRRIQECVTRLAELRGESALEDEALPFLYNAGPDLIAVDLRRFLWNVNDWQEAVRMREEYEVQIRRGAFDPGAAMAQAHRAIDRLGFDQGVRREGQAAQRTVNVREMRAFRDIDQEHHDFLQTTMAETTGVPSTNTTTQEQNNAQTAEQNAQTDPPAPTPPSAAATDDFEDAVQDVEHLQESDQDFADAVEFHSTGHQDTTSAALSRSVPSVATTTVAGSQGPNQAAPNANATTATTVRPRGNFKSSRLPWKARTRMNYSDAWDSDDNMWDSGDEVPIANSTSVTQARSRDRSAGATLAPQNHNHNTTSTNSSFCVCKSPPGSGQGQAPTGLCPACGKSRFKAGAPTGGDGPPNVSSVAATSTETEAQTVTTQTQNSASSSSSFYCRCKSPPGQDGSAKQHNVLCQVCGKGKSKGRFIVNSLVKPLAKMMGFRTTPKKAATQEQEEPTNATNDTEASAEAPPDTDNNDTAWECQVCFDDEVPEEDRLSMDCGHEYCRDCWGGYIRAMLEETRAAGGILTVPAVCPHRLCRQKITRRHVELFAPEFLDTYDEMDLNSFIQGHNRSMRWCPGPDCGNVVVHSRQGLFLHENGYEARFTRCDACRAQFCFDCGDEPHPGEPCRNPGDLEDAAAGDDPDEAAAAASTAADAAANQNRNAAAAAAAVVTTPNPPNTRAARFGFFAGPPPVDVQLQHGNPLQAEDKTDKKIRRCPSCKVPIEKNGGCNHMRCKCGTHFCWLCMANTTSTHGSHFCGREPEQLDDAIHRRRIDGNANRVAVLAPLQRIDMDYVAETVQDPEFSCSHAIVDDILQKRRELFRFAHYFNRYMAHEQGRCFAENECDCLAGRALDFTKVSKIQSCADTDFFNLGNQRLVASRRMLKYTYCFLYYKLAGTNSSEGADGGFEDSECPVDNAMSSSLSISLALFLDHQERLERMTEQLSFLSENALTRTDRQRVVDMINTVDRCMQSVTALSFEERDAI